MSKREKYRKGKMKIKSILFVAFVLIMSANVNATTINFTGTLGFIEIDNGSTTYSGLTIGDSFSGSFTYGDSSADASSIVTNPPISADYSFTGAPYGGTITGGSITTIGTDSGVGIGDNDGMGDDTFYINNLYGTSIPYETISDTWGTYSSNGTQAFGLDLYSFDTSIFSGLGFQILPLTLGNSDIALFYIEEIDTSGTTYLATGILTSITAVPVPAAVWLFGSGLIGLIGIARRKKV